MAYDESPEYPRVRVVDDAIIYSPIAGLTYEIRRDSVEIQEQDHRVPGRLEFALENGALYGYQEHLRRHLPLHASGFVHDGLAFGIAGFSGWGKSTTAAHVRALGPGFLTDDILSIRNDDGVPMAQAGPPKARLWPDAASKVGLDLDALTTVYDDIDKRFVDIKPVVQEAPLGGLYILQRTDDDLSLTALDPMEAVMELVLHTYSVRVLEQRHEPWHLPFCTAVAAAVPIKRLQIPVGLEHVDTAAAMVMEDMRKIGAGRE